MRKTIFGALKKYLSSKDSVILKLYRVDNYNDYPPFYQYTAVYQPYENGDRLLASNGLSFDREEAKFKAVMETVERWHLSQKYKGSAGGAASLEAEDAVYRGLCELAEREAFALYYFNKITPAGLAIPKRSKTGRLAASIERYFFKIHLFRLENQFGLFICLALLEDVTGFKPYFTLGLKADYDHHCATEGAMLECLQSLNALRSLAEGGKAAAKETDPILKRLRYWLDKKPRNNLKFLFAGKTSRLSSAKPQNLSPKKKLQRLLASMAKAGFGNVRWDMVYDDYGLKVAQVANPGLIDLPLTADLPRQKKRLKDLPGILKLPTGTSDVGWLNNIPHPFP